MIRRNYKGFWIVGQNEQDWKTKAQKIDRGDYKGFQIVDNLIPALEAKTKSVDVWYQQSIESSREVYLQKELEKYIDINIIYNNDKKSRGMKIGDEKKYYRAIEMLSELDDLYPEEYPHTIKIYCEGGGKYFQRDNELVFDFGNATELINQLEKEI